jgi:hypothetical protein
MFPNSTEVTRPLLTLLHEQWTPAADTGVNDVARVWRFGAGAQTAYRIHAPSRSGGLRITVAAPSSKAELFKLVAALEEAPRPIADRDADLLREAGLLLSREDIGRPVEFSPSLDAESARLLIRSAGGWLDEGSHDLTSPSTMADGAVAWWHDPVRRVAWPFLAQPLPERGSPATAAAAEWARAMQAAKADLARDGVCVIRDLLPRPLLEHIQDYYRKLIANGHLVFGDAQSRRYNLHNEPLAAWLQHHTRDMIAAAMPERVRPAYSYLGYYVAGATLPKHKDRKQCEITLSLTIEADASAGDAWPIWVEREDGVAVPAKLGSGDAVIFRGHRLAHYRDPLPEGHHYGSMFWCYVEETFEGSVD